MASLFVIRNDVARQRAVLNGGLGGFVTIGSIRVMENTQGDGKATWPKNRRRKNKPPPISIVQESDKYFVKQEVLSPTPIADDSFPQSPRTPISRYNTLLMPSGAHSNHLPPPPLTPKQQLLPSALELPGSLLLPSQGFPQSDPPCTPARPLPCLSRSSSEESDRLWTPAVSISSATDIDDDEMPKIFPPKHLPRAPKPSKSRNFPAPAAHELDIGKPMTAMSAEELLDELPQLSPAVVKAVWIPAMIKQHIRIKRVLQEAAEVHLDTNNDLHDFAHTLESLSRDAHNISHAHEKAVKSAESLIERDAKTCRGRFEIAQNNLEAALTTIDNNHQTIRQKDETIKQLRYTLDDVVRVLGDFIHDHTPVSILRDLEQYDVRNVMQMLEDYSKPTAKDDESTGRFLRVPEEHYMANINALREAQLKTESFREVAISQNRMISNQSKQLDDRSTAYEESMGTVAKRNDEIKSLEDDNERLRKLAALYESGEILSKSAKKVQEDLFRDQAAMQTMLKTMKANHARDLKHRDVVILDLEKKLESANAEVMRGKADVKNVITHTQALLIPVEQPEDFFCAPPTLKERRMMSKAKGKPQGLPTSQSMVFLNQHDPKQHPPNIPERRQSANVLARPIAQAPYAMLPRDVTPQWACGVSQKPSNRDLRDLSNLSPNYAPRPLPRTDSLSYINKVRPGSGDQALTSAVVNQMLGAPIKFDPNKQLPSRPEPHYALDLYGWKNASTMDQVEEWYDEQPQLQPPKHIPGPGSPITQRPRVLSQITERSGEDSASASETGKEKEKDAISVSSSAQEEYKYMNGVDALRMRDFIQQTNCKVKGNVMGKPRERERDQDDKPDYEGRDYYLAEAEPQFNLLEGDVAGVAQRVELNAPQTQRVELPQTKTQSPVPSPVRSLQSLKGLGKGKVYQTSQDGSSSTITKKSSPLREVHGLSVLGDPWLCGT